MQQILSNLPVKTLMKFKCVSKSWESLTHDPSFIKLHQSKSHLQLLAMTYSLNSISVYTPSEEFKGGKPILIVKIPWSQVSIFKLINGLFCFVDVVYNMSRFYNLGTRQTTPWIYTPVPTVTGLLSSKLSSYGFGFDRLTGKYKLLCMWDISKGGAGYGKVFGKVDHVCQVLTMGEDEWRTIKEVPPMRPVGGNVYANGSIYMRNRDDNFFKYPESEVIIAFDLGTEKFRVIPIPDFVINSYMTSEETPFRRAEYLLEVDDHIAIIDRLTDYTAKLWICNDDCLRRTDVKWVEETIVGLPLKWSRSQCIFFQGVKGRKEIIFRALTAKDSVIVYLYDRMRKSFREIVIFDLSPTNNSFNYGMFNTCDTLLPVEQKEKIED
ncbi:hypothetical protein MKW94_022744 [Papaver nudicaule]|uniref:F-box domain-containing protein n=1 Tax=Papaver nudicaule TaxID=74823 RepID=A0AA41S9C7_PAPNU|nr:hypothetical protein [Papaver nudicaule]